MWKINDGFQHSQSSIQNTCHSELNYPTSVIVIATCCFVGLSWAVTHIYEVQKINIQEKTNYKSTTIKPEQKRLLLDIGQKISSGARSFLKQQYTICLIFIAIMLLVLGFTTQYQWLTAIAFLVGALISMVCGTIGMLIATRTNYRVAYCAKDSLSNAFHTAYRAGCSIGFALVSLGLLVLLILIVLYKRMLDLPDSSSDSNTYKKLFEAIAGYGLGGSFVALFGRVGGGIYTKAADVGADMVGKIQAGLNEDSPYNPGTIADNVGDNVGDVAGMSADLFGSFAQSTCAALVISSNTLVGTACDFYVSNLFYPLLLIAFGIIICLFVSIFAFCTKVQKEQKIESTLKLQLIMSTILLIGAIFAVSLLTLPQKFELRFNVKNIISERSPYHAFLCSVLGLLSGLMISSQTEYMTSHSYNSVKELANSCLSGVGSNLTLGLALGYTSTAIPAIYIAFTAYFANLWLGYYGVALAALGMLANLPLSLAIDGYGPISDNAGGIAEMSGLGEIVIARTDALDAAGNTTTAVGKGFAIGSAALVALALYGGFLHNVGLQFAGLISISQPIIFAGLLVGAMLPYLFSAFTIRSVGKAAFKMVAQVRRQLRQNPGILRGESQPDYNACITISTDASLIQMIIPGILVIISPLTIGFIFGPKMLAGFIPGAIVSGVMLATSAINAGSAWENTKKYIQIFGVTDEQNVLYKKGSQAYKAAIMGDTVGDPLKDTSGPALNILMKLMAMISLIFGTKFMQVHAIS